MLKITCFFIFLILFSCTAGSDVVNKQRFLIRGNTALENKEFNEALRLYTEAVQLDSCYADALNNIAVVYSRLGRFSQSVSYCDQAIHCSPTFWDAYLNRASAYYELNELYRALDDLEYLQRQIPDSANVYFGIGLVKTKQRKYQEAINSFSKAIDLDSTNVENRINRATVKYYQKQYTAAIQDLEIAHKMDSAKAEIDNARALINADQNKFDKAWSNINKALAKEPGNAYFLNNRGYIQLMRGNMEEAEKDINYSIVIDPANGWAYRNKGLLYLKKNDISSAITLFNQAIAHDDFIDKIYYFLGNAYLKNNDLSKACEAWGKSQGRGEGETKQLLQKYCGG